MTSWKIVTDSSCDYRSIQHLTDSIAFESVPFNITIGNQVFVDDGSIETADIINVLLEEDGSSSTACPSPDLFAKAFEQSDHILCFTISSNISGSFNSANIAKDLILEKYPHKNIYILDSRSASTEMNLLITKAIDLIHQGLDFQTVIGELESYHQTTSVNFLLFSVNNLVKNGRVPKIIGQMIGLLGINLIGRRTPEGTIELAHKTKGKQRSYRALQKEMVEQGFTGGHLDITHVNNEEHAHEFISYLEKSFDNLTYDIHLATNLNGYYAEKDGIIVSYHTR